MLPNTVYVVEDHFSVRRSLLYLLESAGLTARGFESAAGFLNEYQSHMTGVAILDIRMPGMNGLELQEHLLKAGSALAVLVVTGHGDIPQALRAVQYGAIGFLTKPYNDNQLLELVSKGLRHSKTLVNRHKQQTEISQCYEKLSQREHEILGHILAGKQNKDIATLLNLSVKTVEGHKTRIMLKMRADNLVDLVRRGDSAVEILKGVVLK